MTKQTNSKHRNGPRLQGQSGMSLIGLMMTVVIFSILGMVFMKTLASSAHIHKRLIVRQDLEAMRNFVRVGLDCPQTLNATSSQCGTTNGGGAAIPLKRANGDDLIAISGTVLGEGGREYRLEAYCGAVPGIYRVQVRTERGEVQPLFRNVPGAVCDASDG